MIKAFLFDYDGVITAPVPDGTLGGRLSKSLGVPSETALAWIPPIWAALLKGEMTDAEIWGYFEAKCGHPVPADRRNVWHTWEDLKPLPEMLELIRRLKSHGFPVGIVSNITARGAEDVRKHGGYNEADFAILSCEVGQKKPDPEIFELAMKHLPDIKRGEVLYMDDGQQHVDGAERFGFQARIVTDHETLIREIEGIL